MFNCGMMAVVLSEDTIDKLFSTFHGKVTELKTDFKNSLFTFQSGTEKLEIPFEISSFDRALVEAGGWVNYADSHY
jgi:3-isopropylmalate/(R)-2-methylmalate dehydratase small subunit